MNEETLIAEYARLENQLSPENLHCDGERAPSEARRIGRKLRARQAEIVKQLGRTPTHKELYGE